MGEYGKLILESINLNDILDCIPQEQNEILKGLL